MKNKKIFPYLFFSILIFGFLWFSPIYAQSQTGSVTVDTTGLSSPATINITVNGTDSNGNPLPSRIINLIINPAPLVPPSTPTGFNATPGLCDTGQINLSWLVSSGATSYTLRRDGAIIYTGANLSYLDAGLVADSFHLYTVTASNSGGTSASAFASATAPAICPVAANATADIKANGSDGPITIPFNGAVNITWMYSDANSCTLDPSSIGTISIPPSTGNGSFNTSLTVGRTYMIFCNPGPVSDSVTVNVQPQPKNLVVVKAGQGTVTSSPAGINCGTGPGCQASYDSGTIIVLTEVPNIGRLFVGWSGVVCSGVGENQRSPTCTFTLISDLTITASFAADPDYREF